MAATGHRRIALREWRQRCGDDVGLGVEPVDLRARRRQRSRRGTLRAALSGDGRLRWPLLRVGCPTPADTPLHPRGRALPPERVTEAATSAVTPRVASLRSRRSPEPCDPPARPIGRRTGTTFLLPPRPSRSTGASREWRTGGSGPRWLSRHRGRKGPPPCCEPFKSGLNRQGGSVAKALEQHRRLWQRLLECSEFVQTVDSVSCARGADRCVEIERSSRFYFCLTRARDTVDVLNCLS